MGSHSGPESVGEVWDRIVGSLPSPGSTTGSARRSGLKPLALADAAASRHLPAASRCLSEVDPSLRGELRRLAVGESPWPLFLHGLPGRGKTAAVLCLLDHAQGRTRYHTAADLADLLIRAQQGRLWDEEDRDQVTVWPSDFWAALRKASLVALDEIGARNVVSDHHYECVKRVLDERHGLPLAVVSNLDLGEIGRLYDARIASRLAAGTVVHLKGRDRRVPA